MVAAEAPVTIVEKPADTEPTMFTATINYDANMAIGSLPVPETATEEVQGWYGLKDDNED
jgi:hypothetical protein